MKWENLRDDERDAGEMKVVRKRDWESGRGDGESRIENEKVQLKNFE